MGFFGANGWILSDVTPPLVWQLLGAGVAITVTSVFVSNYWTNNIRSPLNRTTRAKEQQGNQDGESAGLIKPTKEPRSNQVFLKKKLEEQKKDKLIDELSEGEDEDAALERLTKGFQREDYTRYLNELEKDPKLSKSKENMICKLKIARQKALNRAVEEKLSPLEKQKEKMQEYESKIDFYRYLCRIDNQPITM